MKTPKNYLSRQIENLREIHGTKALSEKINERVYNQNLEIENVILGKILLEADSYWLIADTIASTMFSDYRNEQIYSVIQAQAMDNKPFDMISVTEKLQTHKNFNTEGFNIPYIVSLTSRVVSIRNIEYEAAILVTLYVARLGVQMAETAKAHFLSGEADKGLEYIEQKTFEIQNTHFNVNQVTDFHVLGCNLVENYKKTLAQKQSGELPGLTFGFNTMDKTFNRILQDDLIIIAARPSMGKTSFAVSSAVSLAQQGVPVAFFSIESSEHQITTKIASNVLEIPYSDISEAKIDNEKKYESFMSEAWTKLPIYIDDETNLTPSLLVSKVRRLIREKGIKIIFIDYLQKMKPDEKAFSRNDEIGAITGTLKTINKKFGIPVVALAQLNRGNEARGGDLRPKLSDLRSSGEIEQDADKVIFVHRDAYYDIEMKMNEREHQAELICEKNRNGATGYVEMTFDSHITKFFEQEKLPW